MRSFLMTISLLLITLSSVNAQQSSKREPISADDWMLSQLSSYYGLRANTRLEDIRKGIEVGFRKKDLEGDGISQQDHIIEDQINMASRRARAISLWAKNDLDGDGRVTRKEYLILSLRKVPRTLRYGGERVATTQEQCTNLAKKSVSKKMQADIDEDGAVSIQEVIAASKNIGRRLYSLQSHYKKMRQIPSSLDQNQDGKITLNEFTIVSDRLLKRLDTDRSGAMDREEIKYYYQLRKRASKEFLRNSLQGSKRK